MPATYQNPRYAYRRPAAIGRAAAEEAPVVILGGGVVGLTLALDLARRGTPSVLLDEDDTVSSGRAPSAGPSGRSRSWAGSGSAALPRQGVSGTRAASIAGTRGLFLRPAAGAGPRIPGLREPPAILCRGMAGGGPARRPGWSTCAGNKVTGLENRGDGALVAVETPDGGYRLHGMAAGLRRRPQRGAGGAGPALPRPGLPRPLPDRRIVMRAPFPAERRFWFDPPFHPGQSVLLHKQPDDVWRIDFQLGWDADPESEKQPERVPPGRADARRGHPLRARMGQRLHLPLPPAGTFRHGRTIFLGDSAHQVSPFGARGGNGGVQDADNLGWKLAAVLRARRRRRCSTPMTPSASPRRRRTS